MSKSKFEISQETGIHSQMESLTGDWEGTTKTWFEPDVVADESPMRGTIRPILGGRFLMHEYKGSMNEKPFEGIALYGFDLPNEEFQVAWTDTFHMGTGMMFSTGKAAESRFSALGSYGNPEMPERWGWRTVICQSDKNSITITAYNISPEGKEDKATETSYNRVFKG